MFNRLIIKNFQRHRHLEVQFDPNITVLVGRSDKGKSAIIRALRWLCLNRAPKNHIRWDAKFASVELLIDGHKIVRYQSKSKNHYSVDGKKLKAFNRDVPDKVKSILNIDVENFQRQLDSAFWVSLPPPQVTKELNSIVDLSIIDRSLTNINSRIKKTKAEVEVSSERLSEAKTQLKELSWVDEAEKRFKIIESTQANVNAIESTIAELSDLTNDVKRIDEALGDATNELQRIEFLQNLSEEVHKSQEECYSLEFSIQSIERMDEEICRLNEELESCEKKLMKVKVCPICGNKIR